jgi:hypothetical protein
MAPRASCQTTRSPRSSAPLEVDLALAAARGIDGEDLALAHDDLQEVGERRRLEPGLGDGTEGSEGAE